MWVCLFDDDGRRDPAPADRAPSGVWHGALPGVAARHSATATGSTARGTPPGLRFNPPKLLLDPYARASPATCTTRPRLRARPATREAPSTRTPRRTSPRSVVVHDDFDWRGDRPLRHRWRDTVIYELHVKGFTRCTTGCPSSCAARTPGSAPRPSIDYLRDLGVTAVELLPVHQFVTEPALAARGLANYWGYNSIGFFAPHAAYSSSGDRGQQVREFKEMVQDTSTPPGIEVILDVVYNHTAEGGTLGPTLSLPRPRRPRLLQACGRADRPGRPTTPTGTSPAAATPSTHRPAGAAADPGLAALLGHRDARRRLPLRPGLRADPHRPRHRHALPPSSPPSAQDPVLRHVKLIAEPWDASMDGYRVGEFPPPWVEWNDQYRDTMRDFWRGHPGHPRPSRPGSPARPTCTPTTAARRTPR